MQNKINPISLETLPDVPDTHASELIEWFSTALEVGGCAMQLLYPAFPVMGFMLAFKIALTGAKGATGDEAKKQLVNDLTNIKTLMNKVAQKCNYHDDQIKKIEDELSKQNYPKFCKNIVEQSIDAESEEELELLANIWRDKFDQILTETGNLEEIRTEYLLEVAKNLRNEDIQLIRLVYQKTGKWEEKTKKWTIQIDAQEFTMKSHHYKHLETIGLLEISLLTGLGNGDPNGGRYITVLRLFWDFYIALIQGENRTIFFKKFPH